MKRSDFLVAASCWPVQHPLIVMIAERLCVVHVFARSGRSWTCVKRSDVNSMRHARHTGRCRACARFSPSQLTRWLRCGKKGTAVGQDRLTSLSFCIGRSEEHQPSSVCSQLTAFSSRYQSLRRTVAGIVPREAPRQGWSQVGILDAPMLLTSDPHAWLRPYFAALAQDHTFARLAPSIQFSTLCDALAPEHPAKAAQIREWSPAAQTGTLRWLATVIKECPPVSEVVLWTVRKGERELRCVVRYLPTRLDLRLTKSDDFHRTELHRDADAANAKADEWKTALMERGWD